MIKIYKLLFINLSITFIFIGCTPPHAFTFFKKDELKAKAIQYTKKSEIIKDNEVKAILNATYLNSLDGDFDDEKQNFIIGIFISNDSIKEENQFLNNKEFILSMNDRDSNLTIELPKEHKMYGHLPLYNPWAKYYLIKYDTIKNEKSLNIKYFSQEHNSSAIINFEPEY